MPFWSLFAIFWANKNLPEKSSSVTFECFRSPNFIQKIRKNLRANSEKTALRTDGRTDRPEFIGPFRLCRGSNKGFSFPPLKHVYTAELIEYWYI